MEIKIFEIEIFEALLRIIKAEATELDVAIIELI